MPETETYDQRRERLHARIQQDGRPLTDLVAPLDYSYKYVHEVLRGAAGKRSAPVLDALEAELGDE